MIRETNAEHAPETPALNVLLELERAAGDAAPISTERRLYALLVDTHLLWTLPRAHWRRAADLGLIEMVQGGAGGERV